MEFQAAWIPPDPTPAVLTTGSDQWVEDVCLSPPLHFKEVDVATPQNLDQGACAMERQALQSALLRV